MGRIKILKPGTQTTIQDRGRFGFQSYGMVVSGAMDSYSHRTANLLVENPLFEAVLEVCLSGLEMEFLDDSVIAITGGNISPVINYEKALMWKSLYVRAGDKLSFGKVVSGCRSYVAIAGGLKVPLFLNSKSVYLRGAVGPFKGRMLTAGDIIETNPARIVLKKLIGRMIPPSAVPKYSNEMEIRVIIGPQDDHFTDEGIINFLGSIYTVTKDCDRMGCRLQGRPITHLKSSNIISDALTFGSIQVPENGLPIIMLSDRQTTGGYPKIATVITADLPLLAQAKPRDKISFKNISVSEAQNILRNTRY